MAAVHVNMNDVKQPSACSASSAFGLITRADVAPLTLDLENKSKNRRKYGG